LKLNRSQKPKSTLKNQPQHSPNPAHLSHPQVPYYFQISSSSNPNSSFSPPSSNSQFTHHPHTPYPQSMPSSNLVQSNHPNHSNPFFNHPSNSPLPSQFSRQYPLPQTSHIPESSHFSHISPSSFQSSRPPSQNPHLPSLSTFNSKYPNNPTLQPYPQPIFSPPGYPSSLPTRSPYPLQSDSSKPSNLDPHNPLPQPLYSPSMVRRGNPNSSGSLALSNETFVRSSRQLRHFYIADSILKNRWHSKSSNPIQQQQKKSGTNPKPISLPNKILQPFQMSPHHGQLPQINHPQGNNHLLPQVSHVTLPSPNTHLFPTFQPDFSYSGYPRGGGGIPIQNHSETHSNLQTIINSKINPNSNSNPNPNSNSNSRLLPTLNSNSYFPSSLPSLTSSKNKSKSSQH